MTNTNKDRNGHTSAPLKFNPKTESDRLALELAEALGEPQRLSLYRVVCENKPAELIQRALSTVRATPDEKIRKSRSALFFFLLNKYAKDKN